MLLGAFAAAAVVDWYWQGGLSRGVGLIPERVFHGEVWRLLGFVLVHHQLWQLVSNALILWIVARRIEERWGTAKFLSLCVACSVATATIALPGCVGRQPYLGASGMVLGLVLTYAWVFGRKRIVAHLPAVQLAGILALIAGMAAFQPDPITPTWGAAGGGVLAAAFWLTAEPVALRWRVARSRRLRIRRQCRIAEMRDVVDGILDKINQGGMESLTRQELLTLRRASRLYASERAVATAQSAAASSR